MGTDVPDRRREASVPKTWSFSGEEGEASFSWWDDFIAASGVQEEDVSVEDADAARNARLAYRLIDEVANHAERPMWRPGDELEDERAAALAAVRSPAPPAPSRADGTPKAGD